MTKFLALLCIMAFLPGCAVTGDYKLRVGDEVRVIIWQKLDEKAIIRPDKKISLPLAGEVICKNKTPAQLSSELSDKYEAQTTVMVTKYHSLKDDFKQAVGVIRDLAILYFISDRIIDTQRK